MKKKLLLLSSIFICLGITSCGVSFNAEDIKIDDLNLNVYQENVILEPTINGNIIEPTYTYEGDDIRIEGNKVIALKADSSTEVTLKYQGIAKNFKVNVINRPYVSTHLEAEINEGWFNDVKIEPIKIGRKDFVNGMDLSMVKRLYECGAKYYNYDGIEQSIFQIVKENGVNYIRIRLWNDPYESIYTDKIEKVGYGGGDCDLNRVTWMLHEAKCAGLKTQLDFHYSDWWADPGAQVIPKAWKDIKTSEELAKTLQNFTKNTLLHLKNNDALPDSVQLGNEMNVGLFVHNPGKKGYSWEKELRKDGTEGTYNKSGDKNDNKNLLLYLDSASKAVRSVSSDIDIIIHGAFNFNNVANIKKFYGMLNEIDYDIIGLSCYSFWHFKNFDDLKYSIWQISNGFKDKEILLAETGYGYTFEYDEGAENMFWNTGNISPIKGYEANIQGQANFIRSIAESIASIPNGLGFLYWEGAWLPIDTGNAKRKCLSSWANMAFFSYDGKATGALKVFNKIHA